MGSAGRAGERAAQVLLDIAQEKFNSHIQSACDTQADGKQRLRALDRALAMSEYLDEVASDMEKAKAEVERRWRDEEERKVKEREV